MSECVHLEVLAGGKRNCAIGKLNGPSKGACRWCLRNLWGRSDITPSGVASLFLAKVREHVVVVGSAVASQKPNDIDLVFKLEDSDVVSRAAHSLMDSGIGSTISELKSDVSSNIMFRAAPGFIPIDARGHLGDVEPWDVLMENTQPRSVLGVEMTCITPEHHINTLGRMQQKTFRMVRDYALAEVSLLAGEVDQERFASRMNTCMACPKALKVQDGYYCGACGCGDNRRAELRTKLRMPMARCPLNKWPKET